MDRLFVFAEFPAHEEGQIIPITAKHLDAALKEAKALHGLKLKRQRSENNDGWCDQGGNFYLQDDFSTDPFNERDVRKFDSFCKHLGFDGEDLSIFMRSLM
jgi:hypothetical protein